MSSYNVENTIRPQTYPKWKYIGQGGKESVYEKIEHYTYVYIAWPRPVDQFCSGRCTFYCIPYRCHLKTHILKYVLVCMYAAMFYALHTQTLKSSLMRVNNKCHVFKKSLWVWFGRILNAYYTQHKHKQHK